MDDLNRIKVLSGLDESKETNEQSMQRFQKALVAPDAKVKLEKGQQFDPLSSSEYQISVYSVSVDPKNVYVAEIGKFRNVYMSDK